MAIFTEEFIHEYQSKYAQYLDDDKDNDEDEEDDEDDEEEEDKDKDDKKDSSKSSDNNKKPSEVQHLSKEEIRRIMTIVTSTLMDYPKLKKCCDYVDLNDKDHINDDGERESSFGKYYNGSAKSYIELINGDVYSGYPDFKEKGNEAFEKDSHAFVKDINELLSSRHIPAKFSIGEKEDDAVSFGVKSTKEK